MTRPRARSSTKTPEPAWYVLTYEDVLCVRGRIIEVEMVYPYPQRPGRRGPRDTMKSTR